MPSSLHWMHERKMTKEKAMQQEKEQLLADLDEYGI